MAEFDLPIVLSFPGKSSSDILIHGLEEAREQIFWEQSVKEDGSIEVRILNVVNIEEKADKEA